MNNYNLLLYRLKRKKHYLTQRKALIIFIIVSLLSSSCIFNRKAVSTQKIESDFQSCYSFETLNVPSCKFEISSGLQSLSLNGSVFFKGDSICYFRGKILFEAVRGAIYRDNFVVVNYFERVCYTGSNDYLQQQTGFPVNPKTIMTLLTADRCEDVFRNIFNFEITPVSEKRILMHDASRNLLEMDINADNTVEKIAMYTEGQRQPLFTAIYGDYQNFDKINLPTDFNLSTIFDNAKINIRLHFNQVYPNQSQSININIPASYKKVVLK